MSTALDKIQMAAVLATSRNRNAGAAGNAPHSLRVTIEKLQPFKTRGIKIIVDIFGQICLYVGFAQTQAGRPFPRDPIQILGLQTVIARVLKYRRQIESPGDIRSKPPAALPKKRKQKACR